jgi:cobalamin biosynthesis protein CobT
VSQSHHRSATALSDLSFLNLESTEEGTSHYFLQKSHVSIVICGSDNLQWVGYAFTNSADDEDGDEDETDEDEDEDENRCEDTDGDEDADQDADEDGYEDADGDDNEGGGEYQADLFASEDSYRVLDANIPTNDAREYWLGVVDLRLRLIVDKWEYAVHKVEQSVKNHVGC